MVVISKSVASWCLIVLLLAGFVLVDLASGGFATMHRYGVDENGRNWAFHFTWKEKLFGLALFLLALPAAWLLSRRLAGVVRGEGVEVVLGRLERVAPWRFVLVLALVGGVLVLLVAALVLHWTPLTDDENTYLFMGRIIASGRLALASHPAQEFFDNIFVINDGRWYGQFPFGFPAFLALGCLLGSPYLATILAAAVLAGVVYLIGRRAYGARAGVLAGLLALVSPTYLATSATLLSHSSVLLFIALAALGCVIGVESDRDGGALLAGVAGGIAFHMRPLTAALLLLPPVLVLIGHCRRLGLRAGLRRLACLLLPSGLAVAGMLYLNQVMNGSPFLTNYDVKWAREATENHILGFGVYPWEIHHTFRSALRNLVMNLIKVDLWLFGWPVSLIFVLYWAASPGKRSWDLAWAAAIVLSFAAYFFYFWPGVSDTGPVLYFELLLPFALLSARGMLAAVRRHSLGGVMRFVLASTLVAWATFHQVQARTLRRVAWEADEPYRLMEERGVHHAVVFMDYYIKPFCSKSWVAGRRNPTPVLRDDRLYVLDLNLCREKMAYYFPNRDFYRFRYDEETDEAVLEPVFMEVPAAPKDCVDTPVTDLPSLMAKLRSEQAAAPAVVSRPGMLVFPGPAGEGRPPPEPDPRKRRRFIVPPVSSGPPAGGDARGAVEPPAGGSPEPGSDGGVVAPLEGAAGGSPTPQGGRLPPFQAGAVR